MHLWRFDLGKGQELSRHGKRMEGMRRVLLAVTMLVCLGTGVVLGEAPAYPAGGIAPQSKPVPIERLAGAWFIGDSQTAPFDLTSVMPGVEFEYDIGMSLRLLSETMAVRYDGRNMRVEEKLRLKNPTALYIWLGSNGIDRRPAPDVLANYETLLKTIRSEFPLLPVYCVSATPVRAKAMERYPGYSPEKILDFNRGLLELCEEYGAYYLDFHSLLAGEDGYMKTDYAAGDGIHLRYHTYELLRDYVLAHAAHLPQNEEAP